MATPARFRPPPTVLPNPLYSQDPALYSKPIHVIEDTCGLTAADRLVLLGVLKHIPVVRRSQTTSIVSRVLFIDQEHLNFLADLFIAGLLDARSWGRYRKGATRNGTAASTSVTVSGQTTPAEPLMSSGYNDLMRQLGILSPFPTGPEEDATTPAAAQNDQRSSPAIVSNARGCLHAPILRRGDIRPPAGPRRGF